MTIDVKPGYKAGTRITFAEDGIAFIIGEKAHSVFQRHGDNLETTLEIPLVDALTGPVEKSVVTLDGRRLVVKAGDGDSVLSPGQEIRVSGEGMPNSKTGRKGDLVCKAKIVMPSRIPQSKKQQIRSVLSSL